MSVARIKAGEAFYEILAVDKTAPELKAVEKELNRLQSQGAKLTDSLRSPTGIYRDTIIELKQLRAVGAIDGDTFTKSARQALDELLQEIGSKVQRLGQGILTVGAAITAVAVGGLTGLGASINEFADFGGEIDDVSQRTGLSSDWVQSFKFAAEMAGSSLGDVEAGLRVLQKNVAAAAGGNEAAQKKFAKLGLSFSDLMAMSPDQQMLAIADALSKIDNPAERTARAMEVLGKGGAKLLPAMAEGAKGLREQFKYLSANGLMLGADDIAAAAELGDKMDLLSTTVAQVVRIIGAALAPVAGQLLDMLIGGVTWVGQFVNANRELVRWLAGGFVALMGLGAAIMAVGATLIGVGFVISSAVTVWGAIVTLWGAASAAIAFMLTPLGAIIGLVALVAGLTPVIVYFFDQIVLGGAGLRFVCDAFAELWEIASLTVGGIFDALSTGDWGLAGTIAMAALNLAVQTGFGGLKLAFADFSTWLTNLFVDLFGAKIVGLVLKGIRAVIDAVNDAAEFFGVDAGLDTTGLTKLINAAARGDNALKTEFNNRNNEYKASVQSEIDGAKKMLELATQQAAKRRETRLKPIAQGGLTNLALAEARPAKQFEQQLASGATSSAAVGRLAFDKPIFDSLLDESKKQTAILEDIAGNTENLEGEGAGE